MDSSSTLESSLADLSESTIGETSKRFPKNNEGFMTEKKIAIVKNEAIGKIALEMGLHKWLILSRNAEEKKQEPI